MAIIPKSGLKSMSDGGIRVSVDTQELTPEQTALLFQFKGGVVKFVLAQEDAKIEKEDIEIPAETLEYKGEKSKSQIQRNVLYLMWENTSQSKPFEEYYRIQMDRIIQMLKEKLN